MIGGQRWRCCVPILGYPHASRPPSFLADHRAGEPQATWCPVNRETAHCHRRPSGFRDHMHACGRSGPARARSKFPSPTTATISPRPSTPSTTWVGIRAWSRARRLLRIAACGNGSCPVLTRAGGGSRHDASWGPGRRSGSSKATWTSPPDWRRPWPATHIRPDARLGPDRGQVRPRPAVAGVAGRRVLRSRPLVPLGDLASVLASWMESSGLKDGRNSTLESRP